ncbi:hypothetical protein GCM10010517_09070 [Streptosporangium fragile]|uniref:OmpR/PhoB-type domain-containing protein n=1 Tax=Streptosporangium fragile TaxID=46186 RepID=A0ABN3VTV0_9ACTN
MHLDLLGPVSSRRGSRALDPGEPRRQAVLCILAVNAGQVVAKDRLIDGVWGENPPKTAGQSIYTYVSGLRRVLEPDRDPRRPPRLLVSAPGGYALRLAPERVDALLFERRLDRARRSHADASYEAALRSVDGALELWRGPCLSGVPGPFAEFERERLGGLHLSALELRADLLLLLGRPQEAAALLFAVIPEHPLRERLRELYMVALYRCGRQAEALDVYQETRRLLMAELGIEPHESLRRCHELILRAAPLPGPPVPPVSPAPEPSRPAGHRVAAPEEVPRQLPRDPVGFVGRAEELARLRALLSPADGGPPRHVVAVTGAPGSGKSTLAVRDAHLVRDRFPGGQLYANLRGATPGIRRLEPIEVITRFLRDLGTPPRAVPTDVDEAAAMWRSRLDGREILVVLDDAADLAQIRPLLSVPVGNAILATSRESLALLDDGAHVPITGMRRAESAAMLANLIGAERAAADVRATTRLIDLCGGLPLAVGIAGARLAKRPRWSVADLVGRLDDERRRRNARWSDWSTRTSRRNTRRGDTGCTTWCDCSRPSRPRCTRRSRTAPPPWTGRWARTWRPPAWL